MRRMILLAATLPLLLGVSGCSRDRAGRDMALNADCGAICDELGAGAWSVTVTPPSTVMTACSKPGADHTAVNFPATAIGMGEMAIAPAPSGHGVEFHSAAAPERITGTLDPDTLAVQFELRDDQGDAIRCAGTLQKFSSAGSQGWTAQTACRTGFVGAADCTLDPSVSAALVVQTILPEPPPSP
jgi:hypothetical protein